MEEKIHVLAVPYPAEGHITPLLHFTKRLACRGFQITLVIPSINVKSKAAAQLLGHQTCTFKIIEISDGMENVERKTTSVEAYFIKSMAEMSKNLDLLILELLGIKIKSSESESEQQHNNDDDDEEEEEEEGKELRRPPDVLVYDSTMPWAMEIAHRHGLLAASFFTGSFAANFIYYNIFQRGTAVLKELLSMSSGNVDNNNDDGSSVISVPPPLPPLEIKDLPYCAAFQHYLVEKFFPDQFLNLQKADWIFINSFDNLETEVARWITSRWPFKTIGPTILKVGSDRDNGGLIINGTEKDDLSEYNSCLEWLNRREVNSVVYVSFGTIAVLSEAQMEEIGKGLINSNCSFIWTVRAEEESKIPAKIRSELSSLSPHKGLILKWCPQLQVLGHKALACFVTHCGWNSTMEAMSSGVPMIGMPFLVDQMPNAKFIADVWEVGVRVKAADGKGCYSSEEIEMSIKEVTQSQKGKELKQNVLKWKQEIENAIAPGGSSSKNIDDFVSELLSSIKIKNHKD